MVNPQSLHVTIIDFGLSVKTQNDEGSFTKLDGYTRFSPLE
jgi:hypothetical protein